MDHQRLTTTRPSGALWVLLLLLLLPEGEALALGQDPPEKSPVVSEAKSRPLLAARRRRKYPRRPAKPAKPPRKGAKAAPEPAPAEPAEPTEPAADPADQAADPNNLQRGGRVEFDGRLVQGQTAKSGAIYLFARKRTQLRSMVLERIDFRKEVLRTVYPSYHGEKIGEKK